MVLIEAILSVEGLFILLIPFNSKALNPTEYVYKLLYYQ
ncbi:hypothetical protein JCM19240_1185 [Vibrio maritimus]|uniref:Uncharacterized protein n=1 Tax=Vibrio maritimus TaxID=990268 RepID=A0A090TTA6_9VIBR|nr:hypothetical protein JCM19240_1185 [Vibrio maritimus]